MRRPIPAQTQRHGSLLRRLDEAAGWINPFLAAIAVALLILLMSGIVMRLAPRLRVTHVGDPQAFAAPGTRFNVPMPPS